VTTEPPFYEVTPPDNKEVARALAVVHDGLHEAITTYMALARIVCPGMGVTGYAKVNKAFNEVNNLLAEFNKRAGIRPGPNS